MEKTIILYILLNFAVSFFSDVTLNDLSRPPLSNLIGNNTIIFSLRPYFQNKSIIQSGIYAGLTIVSALILNMFLSKIAFGFYVPSKNIELMKFLLLAFPLGYVIDIFISRAHIFGGGLIKYYQVAGEGFWGATSFLFSLAISYILMGLFTKCI